MVDNGISVDTADLARYRERAGALSDEIVGAAKNHLAGNLSLPGDLFGDLGHAVHTAKAEPLLGVFRPSA
ncbi:MAG TPA: hypothetical protein VJT49_08905 [Amycolatopsis sp.]|uniref:hypothetical protein n=1 Tax=Amycolatopsis sp. TaxID=37632 RepID=UPI002B493616|nr:hypothetical protein [Amycolatopsis sp.]HKS45220.1 hypothetical protein [Amycolatopsis sp.]